MKSTPKTSARGRPRKFDKDAVLQLIVKVFWAKGYSGTSLDDLATATRLSRPSLYAAYGNKLSMYLATLEVFGHRMATEAGGALATGPDLRTGLLNFYDAALDIYLGKDEEMAQGCLVFTTAVTEATNEPEIKAMVQAQLAGMDQAVKALIADRAPGIAPSAIAAAAELATGTLLNLATRARAGTPRERLREVAQATADAVAALTRARPA
ncbi:HTH-type transcriptional repressor ComR [Rhodobiaceae bacterium]|nr:HTH-type transcriptional repressor ComR [Rhodobiaceae bacterium]